MSAHTEATEARNSKANFNYSKPPGQQQRGGKSMTYSITEFHFRQPRYLLAGSAGPSAPVRLLCWPKHWLIGLLAPTSAGRMARKWVVAPVGLLYGTAAQGAEGEWVTYWYELVQGWAKQQPWLVSFRLAWVAFGGRLRGRV